MEFTRMWRLIAMVAVALAPGTEARSKPDAGHAPAAVPSDEWAKRFATPVGAMAALVTAVHDRDVHRVLECFSRGRPWYLTTTGGKKPRRSRYTFVQLGAGLKDGGNFRGVLLGDDPDDNLRDQIEQTGRRAWRAQSPTTFVPPDDTVNVFVKWRREGNRYVVEEIGFPGA
jgi:hypothetical protein